ncbi:MAG: DHH family phosphoesterase, partial [Pseudomonadota bacterium]
MTWRTTTLRAVPRHTLSEPDPVLARVLAARGVLQDSERSLELRDLAPLGQLQGLLPAAELVHRYRQGRIVIVGDFDADGATSAALLVRGLTALGFAAVTALVPNRFEFGYGLSPEIVDVALADQPDLIITVDNGISSVAGVAHARAEGVAVLVTDHHLAPEQLPDANVIVNPNQPG